MVQKTIDNNLIIKERLKKTEIGKKLGDLKRRPLDFNIGNKAYVKVWAMKGIVRFNKAEKLIPRYIGPFEILERVETLVYRLDLPPDM